MIVNLWLALRDDAQALIKTRLNWDEESQGPYTGPVTNRQFKLFRLMADLDVVGRLFRLDNDGSNDWNLWSLFFDFETNVLQKIQDELDALVAEFPNHVKIVGAWNYDTGAQVGYPLHARILEFIHDVVTHDSDGNETSRTRPTVPRDSNLLFGQAVRDFS